MRLSWFVRSAGRSAAIALLAGLLPVTVQAESGAQGRDRGSGCDCPAQAGADPASRRERYEFKPLYDARDEAAALEAVQVALTEVGDGSTYVWYRHGGRLSGLVQPTQSFEDALGRVCRHIVVTLNDASRSRRAEGIACRLADGHWQLDG
ncbi:MAG: RT0821/Lpp0805 family surface protein [Hyphomicrobiaceae bacterium]